MSLACWRHGVIWASGSGRVSVELLGLGLARFPGSGLAMRCPDGITHTRVPEPQSQSRTLTPGPEPAFGRPSGVAAEAAGERASSRAGGVVLSGVEVYGDNPQHRRIQR